MRNDPFETGTFVDPNTGERRSKGWAKGKPSEVKPAAPQPKEPPKPKLPPFALSAQAIDARAKCVGNWEPELHAAHLLQVEFGKDLAWLAAWNAAEAAEITAEQVRLEEARLANTLRLETLRNQGRQLEQQIIHRASLREQHKAISGQLDAAKATLADPDCLSKPDSELLRLKLTVEHLPAKLARMDSEITESTATIEALVDLAGVDRDAFMREMLKAAKGPDCYSVADQRTLTLRAQGHLSL